MGKEIKVIIERNENIELVFKFENELKLNLSSDKTNDTQNFFFTVVK